MKKEREDLLRGIMWMRRKSNQRRRRREGKMKSAL